MRISQDFWDEFILWAKVCYYQDKEADIYDVFMRMREQEGNRPFSKNFIKNVDYEIAAEDRRNARLKSVEG